MAKFTSILLLIFCSNCFPQDQVYFAQSIGGRGIILEDHITFRNNLDAWGKTERGMNYEAYTDYMKDIAKKYASYNDTVREYSFSDYKPEFGKLTDIMPGDKFYISSEKDVYLSEVTGYYMRMDDEFGGGNIFYAFLKNPKESNEADVKLDEYELLVCTKNGNMSRINRAGITDDRKRVKFKKLLMPMLKKVKVMDEVSRANKWYPLSGINDSELKIFRAPITNAVDEMGRLIDLYVVSYCRSVSDHDFASGIWIMDKDGKVLKEFSKLRERDFNYMRVTGIIDTDGDGIYELITEDGYYEGSGAGIWKYTKDKFEYIAGGFAFGV